MNLSETSLPYTRVEEIASLWELDHLQPFHNLSYNYVLEGYQKDIPIVLKISLDELSLDKELKALKTFANFGAVDVLNHTSDALLLQRAVPGNSLKTHFPQGTQDGIKIACDMAKRLHQAPLPNGNHFPNIESWLETLDKEWDISLFHRQKARALKRALIDRQETQVLLHGDLHRGNILSDGNSWVIIDPKGVLGSPINEMWAFVEDPKNDLVFIANYFELKVDDVIEWYYVHLVMAACWQAENNLDPTFFLNLAESVLPMIKN